MKIHRTMPLATALLLPHLFLTPLFAAQERPSPPTRHTEEVQRHGDTAMGFSHLKTTHHFLLTPSGGYIRVAANASTDSFTRDMVRMHLTHIAQAFKAGDFSSPMFTHGRVPPGVPLLKQMKDAVAYQYQETENGGQVRLTSENPRAISAIHQFLRFQIRDHQTGDSTAVQR